MTESDPKPELEIKSDADWKRQVKQEAAQLDAQRQHEHSSSETAPRQSADTSTEESATSSDSSTKDVETPDIETGDINSAPLPPADFTMLVTMFSTQAMVCLGVIPNPETGQADPNLPLAKHFIDLLGVLQDKTRRNLTGHEADLLENSLHQLRLGYVELSKPAPTEPSP